MNAERIEQVIRDVMAVCDVVVVPYPHDALGCVPVAVVAWHRSEPFKPDMYALVKPLEEPFIEMPHWFITVAAIPTNGAGKIDRAATRRLVPDDIRRGRPRRVKPLKTLLLVARSMRDRRLPWRILKHPIKYFNLARHVARERPLWDSGSGRSSSAR